MLMGDLSKVVDGVFAKLAKAERMPVRTKRHRQALVGAGVLVFWLVFSGLFAATHAHEGWSFWTAFYFVFITLTTIGFGDYSSRGWVFYIFVFFGLNFFASAISAGTELAEDLKGDMLQATVTPEGQAPKELLSKGVGAYTDTHTAPPQPRPS
jgi:hypothetical protein